MGELPRVSAVFLTRDTVTDTAPHPFRARVAHRRLRVCLAREMDLKPLYECSLIGPWCFVAVHDSAGVDVL